MPHRAHLSDRRLDRVLFLIYLIVVPLMIVAVLAIALVQTRDARNEAKDTSAAARDVAHETCVHVNRRDRVLRSIVELGVSLTRSLNPDLTTQQQEQLDRIERRARALRPQDCSP